MVRRRQRGPLPAAGASPLQHPAQAPKDALVPAEFGLHLELQETPYSVVGHTHVPLLVKEDQSSPDGCLLTYLEDGTALELRDRRLVINPGSVGQPRDGDPRTSYAIYDDVERTVTVHRLEYEIAATQKKMEKVGLPAWLVRRLSRGR